VDLAGDPPILRMSSLVAISSPYRLVVDSTRVPLETCVDLMAAAVRR
jgi:hypothetical protein